MKRDDSPRRVAGLGLLLGLWLLAGGTVPGADTADLPVGGAPSSPAQAVAITGTNDAGGATSAPPAKVVSPADDEALRSYLEVQAKLHTALLAIEAARREASAAGASNAAVLADRLHQLETALAAQRAREEAATERSSRTLLIAAGGFAGLGVLTLGLIIFYQMRGMTRLAEIASALPATRALSAGHGLPALGAGDSLPLLAGPRGGGEADSARLLGVIDRLERRIQELEQTAEGAPKATVSPGKSADTEKRGVVAGLMSRAKMLQETQRHAEALACCDEAIALEPTLTQAWLIKAAQLQALGREKEALRCYESALQRLDGGSRAVS